MARGGRVDVRQLLLLPCDWETAEGCVFHSVVKCHQKSEKHSKIIPMENDSNFCEENYPKQ